MTSLLRSADSTGGRPRPARRPTPSDGVRLRRSGAGHGATIALVAPAHAAIPPPNRFFIYHNLHTPDFCLAARGNNVIDGAHIVVSTCDSNNRSQRWQAVQAAVIDNVPQFRIKNSQDPTKCLSVAADDKNNGAQLVIWGCKTTNIWDQLWSFRDGVLNPGCTTFTNLNSQKVMGVSGGSTAEGAPVIQWQPLRHPDQEWDSGSTCANPNR